MAASLNLHSSAASAAGIAAALHKWLLDDNVACAAPCRTITPIDTVDAARHLECRDTLARNQKAFLRANPQTTSSRPLPEHKQNEAAPHAKREPLRRAANTAWDGYNRIDGELKTTTMKMESLDAR